MAQLIYNPKMGTMHMLINDTLQIRYGQVDHIEILGLADEHQLLLNAAKRYVEGRAELLGKVASSGVPIEEYGHRTDVVYAGVTRDYKKIRSRDGECAMECVTFHIDPALPTWVLRQIVESYMLEMERLGNFVYFSAPDCDRR